MITEIYRITYSIKDGYTIPLINSLFNEKMNGCTVQKSSPKIDEAGFTISYTITGEPQDIDLCLNALCNNDDNVSAED